MKQKQSNPIYNYQIAINSGLIIVNKDVHAEVERVCMLLDTGYCYYVHDDVDKYINIIQTRIKYSNYSGEYFKLTLWQKFLIACMYGVKKEFEITKVDGTTGLKEKTKRVEDFFQKYVIQMAKKNGKTELLAALNFVELMRKENSHQNLYLMSEDQRQSEIMFEALTNMIDQSIYKKKFKVRKKPQVITCLFTKCKLNLVVGDGIKLQGTKMKVATIEEFHAIRKSIESSVNLSTKSMINPKQVYISTAGMIRDGMYDDMMANVKRWKKNEYNRNLSLVYKLESVKELKDKSMWEKALPNLGVTYSEEDLYEEVEAAQYDPQAKNELLAYIFGIPQSGSITYFDPFHARMQEFDPKKMYENYCVLGVDLATADDFASACFMIYENGKFYTHNITIKPKQKSKVLASYKTEEYQKFVDREELSLSEQEEIDTLELAELCDKYIKEHDLVLSAIAYDKYYANDFIRYFRKRYPKTRIHPVIQGHFTMSDPLRSLTKELAKGNIYHNNSLLRNAILSVVTRPDANGNLIPSKKNSGGNKIDPFAAMFNAYIFITTIGFTEMTTIFKPIRKD